MVDNLDSSYMAVDEEDWVEAVTQAVVSVIK